VLHLFKIILFISLLLLLPDQFTVHTKTKIPSSSGNTIVDTSLITYPIYDIVFKTNTIDTAATGSDNWATTWLSNNNQLVAWGDGGGFNGSNNLCRTNLGFGLLSGSYGNYSNSNLVNGCSPAYNISLFENNFGYCYGVIEVDGVIYFWRNGNNDNPYGAPNFRQELWKSTNGGENWSYANVGWDKPNDFGNALPTMLTCGFVQYDKGTVIGRGDGYIYSTWSKIYTVSGNYRTSQIFLMRVHRDSMETKSAYSFIASSTPTWTYIIGNAVPIFDGGSTFNLINDVSMLFHPLFKRYIFTFYNDRFTPSNCELIILNSNLMWNRNWVTAYNENPFNKGINFGSKAVYANFSQKWMNDTSGVMIYVSHADNFATIEVEFDSNAANPVPVKEIKNGWPAVFFLKQNYPNPFNPLTTIGFIIPVKSKVVLKIFDIHGNEVKTLINREIEAGYHQAEFDASGLSSGIYFYRIDAEDFTSTRKMIFLK